MEIKELNKPYDVSIVGGNEYRFYVQFVLTSATDRLIVVLESMSDIPMRVQNAIKKADADAWVGNTN